MLSRALTLALLLPCLACSPAGQLRALRTTQAALELTCGGSRIADSVGANDADIVAAAACWLADFTRRRLARLESRQAADAAQVERDAAAAILQGALDVCDPVDPSPEQVAHVIKAWSACKALENK